MQRLKRFHSIQQLDPVRDNCEICRQLAGYEFPWDTTRATFIYEPIRWIDRFGWRQLTSLEKQALFHFWYEVGQQMQIQEIPESYDSLECYNLEYEERYFQYNPANQRVGESTFNLFLSWFPQPLRPLIQPFVYALMDERMIEAFGFPQPQPWQRRLLAQLLRSRGQLLRYLPPRNSPQYYSDEPQRSYPQGYDLKDVGPPGMLSELNTSQTNDP